jgi:hypothetical protein
MYSKLLEKQELAKPQISRQKKKKEIRTEINKMETKKTIQRTGETNSWFFERINKINKPLAN